MEITTLCIADRVMRAWYFRLDGRQVNYDKHCVIGWAAVGMDVWPVRVEATSGRGVLVGSPWDPDRDRLLAIGQPNDGWEQLPGVDEKIRALIRADTEERDAEEG